MGGARHAVDTIDIPVPAAIRGHQDLVTRAVRRDITGPGGNFLRLAPACINLKDATVAGIFPDITAIINNLTVGQKDGIAPKDLPRLKHQRHQRLTEVLLILHIESMTAITHKRRVEDNFFARRRPAGVGIFGVGADRHGIFTVCAHEHQIIDIAAVATGHQLAIGRKIRLTTIGDNRPTLAFGNAIEDETVAVRTRIPTGVGDAPSQCKRNRCGRVRRFNGCGRG